MVSESQVKAEMPVVCSDGGQFAVVDHMQDGMIKVKKDDKGVHHFIPMAWVTGVASGKVKVDRPGKQAMKEWLASPKEQKDKGQLK